MLGKVPSFPFAYHFSTNENRAGFWIAALLLRCVLSCSGWLRGGSQERDGLRWMQGCGKVNES